MSHRKFSTPRSGSLSFLPKKRTKHNRGKIKTFPFDNKNSTPHLTAFIGYKSGMTHILRELNKIGSKSHKKEIVDPVTIIETPPMIAAGIVGYQKTIKGLKAVGTYWSDKLSNEFKRRYYKNWKKCKKKAFQKSSSKSVEMKDKIEKKIKEHSDVIRLICHTQICLLRIRQKKAHIIEIQVNGGDISQKFDYCKKKLERLIEFKEIFKKNELCDTISITKGHGMEGVIKRFGVTRLPRKTHRGLRKVACIGAWHPARVSYTVARVGQMGYHHRTEKNKKIYKIGVGSKYCNEKEFNAQTDFDITEKHITPLGGFVRYGEVNEDFVMIKGSCPGVVKRPITIRKTLHKIINSKFKEEINLKWIDTSSKMGHGRFQTKLEKQNWLGPLKKKIK